jgi:hypothetical protein
MESLSLITVHPYFDFEEGKVKFRTNKGNLIRLDLIPEPLDVRGNKRDYTYLQESLLSPNEDATIEILVPLVVFPKGYLSVDRPSLKGWKGVPDLADSYVLLQGNTRWKLILDVVSLLERTWQDINNEPIGDFQTKVEIFYQGSKRFSEVRNREDSDFDTVQELYQYVRSIKPFYLQVIPEEKASDLRFVTWLQVSVNSGVKKHSVLDNARFAVDYFNYLSNINESLPEDQRQSQKSLIREAISGLSIQLSRFYHYKQVLSAPQKVVSSIEDGIVTLDIAVYLLNSYNRLVKRYEEAGKVLRHSLESFFDQVLAQALDPNTLVTKVYKKHVDATYDQHLRALHPDDSEDAATNQREPKDSDLSGGKDALPETNISSRESLDEIVEILNERFASLADRLLAFQEPNNTLIESFDGQKPMYRFSEKTIRQLYSASNKLDELLAQDTSGRFVNLQYVAESNPMESSVDFAETSEDPADSNVLVESVSIG